MLKYKIIIAGAKDVGKSSLIARFCDNIFKEDISDLKKDYKEIRLIDISEHEFNTLNDLIKAK